MSQPNQSAARTTLPYTKYVYILHTASVPFWAAAIAFLICCTNGLRYGPEELFAAAVGVTATLSATMVWAVSHVDIRPAGINAVTRHGVYRSVNRDDIRYAIWPMPGAAADDPTLKFPRQADVARLRSVPTDDELKPGAAARIYESERVRELGRTAAGGKRQPVVT